MNIGQIDNKLSDVFDELVSINASMFINLIRYSLINTDDLITKF